MNDIKFFEISETFKGRFLNRIEALLKAALKCNCEGVEVIELNSTRKLWKKDEHTGEKIFRVFHLFALRGGTPKFDGWSLVGTIDPTPAGNIIRKSPTAEGIDVSAFYDCEPGCDHCKVKRNRKDTFIVSHEDGRQKQVGRQCIKDFLGHASPERIGSLFAAFSLFTDWVESGLREDDENFDRDPRGERLLEPVRFLSYVAWCIETFGYLSNAKAQEYGKTSTKSDALSACFPPSPLPSGWKRIVPTDEHVALAEEAIKFTQDFFKAKPPENDFERNLWLTSCLDFYTLRQLGFASYLIPFLKRQQNETAQREARKDLTHVGEVGTRYRGETLTFKGCWSVDTDYGVLHIQRLEDADRNWLVWKSSVAIEAEEGDEVVIDYTVKAHGDFKGTPQTLLTRCKVKEVLPANDGTEAGGANQALRP